MKLYIYSNRHIKDQVINIEKNGCIVLENDLSKFIWKKYFQYNKLDEIESTINYVQLEKILEKEFRMKFNAIVGNPPYEDSQSTGQNNKIYNPITKKVLELLTDDGVLGPWYTPVSVLKKSKRFSFIGRPGLKEVDFTVNDDFKEGVRICATTLDKTYTGDIKVINSEGVEFVKPGEMIFDYSIVDRNFVKLYQKMKSSNLNKRSLRAFSRNDFGPNTSIKNKNIDYKYPLYKLTKDDGVEIFTYLNREPHFFGKKKFVISRTRSHKLESTIVSDKDFNNNHIFIDVDNNDEVDNVKSFLFSDYYIQHCNNWKTLEGYGFNDAPIYLPKFDKTKKWTSEEVRDFIENI